MPLATSRAAATPALEGLVGLLLGVRDGFVRVILCPIDALLELIAVLRGCRPRGCYDLVDLCLRVSSLAESPSVTSVDLVLATACRVTPCVRARGTPWSEPWHHVR